LSTQSKAYEIRQRITVIPRTVIREGGKQSIINAVILGSSRALCTLPGRYGVAERRAKGDVPTPSLSILQSLDTAGQCSTTQDVRMKVAVINKYGKGKVRSRLCEGKRR
jgi:hypothetical protein